MRTLVLLTTALAGLTMAGAIVWASGRQSITAIPPEVSENPWFLITLLDCYLGVFLLAAWASVRERTWLGRLGWPLAILLLGNLATAVYVGWIVWRAPAGSRWQEWLSGDPAAAAPAPAGPV